MFVRRLIVLFFIICGLAVLLAFRLADLQWAQSDKWKKEEAGFNHRHYLVETARGTIFDAKGRAVAQDVHCYDLAIDYRAMNQDQRWMTALAISRMKAAGIADRRERVRRLPEELDLIRVQLESIPLAVAQQCGMSESEVLDRYESIRTRIETLKQDRWSRQDTDRQNNQANPEEGNSLNELKEELTSHVLVAAVPDTVAFEFHKHRDLFPGLSVLDSRQRIYPYGSVAAQVIGAMRSVSPPALFAHPFGRPNLLQDQPSDDTPGNLSGYLPGDHMGAGGVEQMEEDWLRGRRGVRLLDLDGNENLKVRQEPETGKDVHLTMDIELQKHLQQALLDPAGHLMEGNDGAKHNVAIVVMRIEDNSVLAMISTPTYDLNTYDRDAADLNADIYDQPLMNRAVAGTYAPGSTVKGLVAAAALTNHVVTPEETINCTGHLYPNLPNVFRCWIYEDYGHGHGPLNMEGALEQSCNVYFYTMGQRLGLSEIVKWYRAFGLGQPTGIGLPGELAGQLPNLQKPWLPQDAKVQATYMGIGQSFSVTPLQMANAYVTLLRGGIWQSPRIVEEWPREEPVNIHLPPEIQGPIRAGLARVVESGTGKVMRMKVRGGVAGKTGTAQVTRPVFFRSPTAGGPPIKQEVPGDDAWFIGYVPADNPKYVIAAVMEFGGHGGSAAAPLARATVLELERQGYLPPDDLEQADSTAAGEQAQ